MLHVLAAQRGLTCDKCDAFPHVPHKLINTEFPFSRVRLKAVQAHENVTQEGFCICIMYHRIPENHFHLFRSALAYRYTLTGNLICFISS